MYVEDTDESSILVVQVKHLCWHEGATTKMRLAEVVFVFVGEWCVPREVVVGAINGALGPQIDTRYCMY